MWSKETRQKQEILVRNLMTAVTLTWASLTFDWLNNLCYCQMKERNSDFQVILCYFSMKKSTFVAYSALLNDDFARIYFYQYYVHFLYLWDNKYLSSLPISMIMLQIVPA